MRKINYKVAAALASTAMIVTTAATPVLDVFASQAVSMSRKGSIALQDGTYSINLLVLRTGENTASSAASYFLTDDSVLTIKDGVGKVRLAYTSTMVKELSQEIAGTSEVLTEMTDGAIKYVELTFNSLEETAVLGLKINPFATMIMNVSADIKLDLTSLKQNGTTVTPAPTVVPDATTSPSVVPTAAPTVVPDATTSPSVMPSTIPTVAPTSAPSTSGISLQDGTYAISLSVLKETEDSTSNAGGYFKKEDAVLIVKDKKAKVRLEYSDAMIGNLQQVVGSEKKTLTVTQTGEQKYVEMEFNSLDEIGYLYMEIDTKTAFGVMKHIVRVKLDTATLKKDGVLVNETPATATPAPTVKPTATAKPSQGTNSKYEDGVYELNAYLWHATNDQASMASTAMENVARVKVTNGKPRMYIYTKEMSMGTITAFLQEMKVLSADGTYMNAKIEAYDSKKNPICFSFELPSYDSMINVKVNPMVALMGNQDIAARIKIDYTSMKKAAANVDLTKSPSLGNNQATATKKPAATSKPEATKKPAATSKPAATKKPAATSKPVTATSKPAATTKPATATSKPAATTAPVGTNNTTTTTAPVENTVEQQPAVTTAPEVEEAATQTPVPTESATTMPAEQSEAQESAQPIKTLAPVKKESTSNVLMAIAAMAAAAFAGTAGITIKNRLKAKKKEDK